MNIRTQDRQAGVMEGGGILVEGKEKATLLPMHFITLAASHWNSPEVLLSLFPTTSITCGQRSHLSIPPDGAHTSVPSLQRLEQIWFGICCAKIKAGQ